MKLRCTLSSRIGSRRFSHTLGVEKAIIDLGERYLPTEIPRLRVAALLHDLTKEWQGERQLDFCMEHHIPLSEEEKRIPKILHAKTAAYLAAKEFAPFVDKEILTAIERHTTAAAGMTVFDELLYLADYIEPTRTYPECVVLRETFYKGYDAAADKERHLDSVMLLALKTTVSDIEKRGGEVFPDTNNAILYLEEKLKREV